MRTIFLSESGNASRKFRDLLYKNKNSVVNTLSNLKTVFKSYPK